MQFTEIGNMSGEDVCLVRFRHRFVVFAIGLLVASTVKPDFVVFDGRGKLRKAASKSRPSIEWYTSAIANPVTIDRHLRRKAAQVLQKPLETGAHFAAASIGGQRSRLLR